MTIAATAQAACASVELANSSGGKVKNLVGRSGKKLQRFLRDVSAYAPSGYRASTRKLAKNPFAYRPVIRQIRV
jgi:hypothetical protein